MAFNQTIYIGETVNFDASKSVDDGEIVSYKWDFGDGTHANGVMVSHSYFKEGAYQVILNVTDNDGLWDNDTMWMNINLWMKDGSITGKQGGLTWEGGNPVG